MNNMLPPDQWRPFTPEAWSSHRAWFLGDDEPDLTAVQRILATKTYQPDTFTIAERLSAPAWLDDDERDPNRWLTGLVRRRTAAVPAPLSKLAQAYVTSSLRRLLDLPGVPASIFNQEFPYIADRVAAWCLLSNPDIGFGLYHDANIIGQQATTELLTRHGHLFASLATEQLIRVAIAAGLLGLDLKGGQSACDPIYLRGWTPDSTPQIAAQLLAHAGRTPAADDIEMFLSEIQKGQCRLLWWLDDVNETAFDLLVAGRLLDTNPHLSAVLVAKSGNWDNDATADEVKTFLPLLPSLTKHLITGRLRITSHGPRMATINPLRLHQTVLREIAEADVMVCKGGRIHEMFNGQLRIPTYTGIVLAREFSETTGGYDAAEAPLLWFRTGPREWSWWGFQGRTRRLALASGRIIRASHVTVAEHRTNMTTADPRQLTGRLEDLLKRLPTFAGRYEPAARAEIALIAGRLGSHSNGVPGRNIALVNAQSYLRTV